MSIDPPSPWIQWLILIMALALAGCARARRIECDAELVPINDPAAVEEFDMSLEPGQRPMSRSESRP